MTWTQDPPRLLDGGDNALLQGLLQAGREELPTAEQLEQLAARLGPALTDPGGGGSSSGSGAAGGAASGSAGAAAGAASSATLSIAKIVVAVAVGGVAITGATLSIRSSRESHESPIAVTQASPSATETPSSAPVEPSSQAPVVSVAPEAGPAPRLSAAPTAVPSASSTAAEPATEFELIQQAQSALGADPARALSLAGQHAKRFPGGAFAQEREVIAIQALLKLGRSGEARSRAERFARAFPGSAHVRRLEVLLGPLQGGD